MDLRLPPDPTPEEIKIIAYAKTLIYQKLNDPMDKFIVAFAFDMGYDYEETAIALGVTYKTVWEHIKKIRSVLAKHYKLDAAECNEMFGKLLE